jgi:hypothetical protein
MLSSERLLDLLTARATEGLTARESDELERVLSEQSALGGDDLDLAAAAVYLAYDAGYGTEEAMPEALKRRILPPRRLEN